MLHTIMELGPLNHNKDGLWGSNLFGSIFGASGITSGKGGGPQFSTDFIKLL